jgi:hypothetical protein
MRCHLHLPTITTIDPEKIGSIKEIKHESGRIHNRRRNQS